jgi:hypothetical protein
MITQWPGIVQYGLDSLTNTAYVCPMAQGIYQVLIEVMSGMFGAVKEE